MGIKNYLIEGGSGTGKTSVATELERRGYHVVHGDRVLAYVGDPETGQALAAPPKGADRIVWGYAHWIWPVDKVRAIAVDTTYPVTFFCGGSRNFQKFRCRDRQLCGRLSQAKSGNVGDQLHDRQSRSAIGGHAFRPPIDEETAADFGGPDGSRRGQERCPWNR
ncbi:hypothetical protein SM0020_28295 [Sinorhizobium meliloti CCNWSX0020]|uniref:Uncharacterized protein n=1 Tax=Sinorhizobium meliloti CCNWSX0020 TaxID=1107881 RepID=H0G824_RHIML|nr:hypothetical protein SM0020_28295 [Sinorhizobium meliloti CCNWSX0020]